MTLYIVAYAVALIAFAAMDIVWLTTMGASLYRSTLGDILLPSVRIGPAIVFYLMYPVGLVAFAIDPALRSQSVAPALAYGAMFGAISYATYDLTNFATLRNWTLEITVVDIVYGALMGAAISALTYYLAPAIAHLLGAGK
jgi:uncharacterized membrane protein